jgi:hypothetical protein
MQEISILKESTIDETNEELIIPEYQDFLN